MTRTAVNTPESVHSYPLESKKDTWIPRIYTDFIWEIFSILYIIIALVCGFLSAISYGFEKGIENTLTLYRRHIREGR